MGLALTWVNGTVGLAQIVQVRTELQIYVKQKTDEILNLNNQVRCGAVRS
jgi:hypothetical protein